MLGCASREAANMRAMPWSGTQASVWQETVQIGRRRRGREGGREKQERRRDMKQTTKLYLGLVFLTDKYWAMCSRKLFFFFFNFMKTYYSWQNDPESEVETSYYHDHISLLSLSYLHYISVAAFMFYFAEKSTSYEALLHRIALNSAPWHENDWEALT